MTTQNKRERLVDSAATLFHQHGMTATSLADIAKHADIPIGNVYYYFKAKEELALAAIEKRRQQFAAAYAMLDEAIDDPRQRLIGILGYFEKVREEYAKYGCPVARIIEDSNGAKDNAVKMAAHIFTDFVDWAERQFIHLGHNSTARDYATSLLVGIQGSVLVAKAFQSSRVITSELARLTVWLESIPNRKISLGKVSAKAETAA